MASSLIVLNNTINSQLAETNPSSNSSNNTTSSLNIDNSNKPNETSLINITSRVSSASSNSSRNNAGVLNTTTTNNNNQSVVTIVNNERSNLTNTLPSLSLSTPKYTEKSSSSEDNANQKIYISTHHLKMSNKESTTTTITNTTNVDNKKITIVNNTRENSAKIKIKYKHNIINVPTLSTSTPPPLFSPLHSPNSLPNNNNNNNNTKKFSSNDMDMPISPSSSSPSSPSSLISNPSDSSDSPLPNLILSQSSNNSLNTGFLDDEQHSNSNTMIIESNKLHLSIIKPNVIRASSFISEKITNRSSEHSQNE